jgi:acyl-CoA synthetase (AMP-forming)/AMP-acid ligase II
VTPITLLHDILDVAAADHPGRPALSHGSDVADYRLTCERSIRLAAWLRDQGVTQGDRVVVALPVTTFLPALLFGCSRVGAVFVVVRPDLPGVSLAHVLDDARPALVFADGPVHAALAAQRGLRMCGTADLLAAGESGEPARGGGPLSVDPVCFVYTSGSTGMPKAVVSTHAQAVFAARAIQSQLRYRPDDVVYSPLPLSFDYGLYQIFLCALAGARLALGSADESGGLLATRLHELKATVFPTVPSLAAGLARLLSRPGAAVPDLRLLTNTGAAMPPHVLAQLRAKIPGLRVQLMFGLTECKRAAIMPEDEDLHHPGACGRALPGTEIYAVTPAGDRLPPGEIGELVVRGPNVMAGYWHRPELTAARFERVDGLFPRLRTGDYGWLDEDGYVYFAGRRDDQYKERGVRVSITEVEAASHRVPGVEAAVVVPPAAGRDSATLIVVAALTPSEVLVRLRGQLEEVKAPAHCMVVPALPLTGHGKVDRAALARMAAKGQA